MHPSQAGPESSSSFTSGPAIVLYLAAAKLLAQLLTDSRYGYFRDELYYLACSQHLDWGYVDQPPLIAAVAWFARHIFGESLLGLRLLPALAGAVLVWLAGAMARQLGGGRWAQAFAALCAFAALIFLLLDHWLTMNAFEPLFWMGCAWLVIRIIQTGEQRLWIWFGAMAGLGLQNKYATALFLGGVVVGLLVTRERKALRYRWIWIGGAIAILIFLPNLIWNIQHHWPFLELMRNIRASGRDIRMGPLQFLATQVLIMSPITLPVWLAGLWYFFFSPQGKAYRPLGWAFLITLGTLIVLHGKLYYPAPAYPMLFSAGAVAIEGWLARPARAWLKPVAVAVLILATLPLVPVVMPVLPIDAYLRYQDHLPFTVPRAEKSHLRAALPQHFADEFGWQEMVAKVARVYKDLPAADRARAVIFGGNYGLCGAIDFFGPKYELPRCISGHQNYFLWGPGSATGAVVIMLGASPERARSRFRDVQVVAMLNDPYNQLEADPILLCRGLNQPLRELWPKLKVWD